MPADLLLAPPPAQWATAASPDGRYKLVARTGRKVSLLHEETVLGYAFDGTRYDCGSKLGYLQANVMYGLKHAEVGAEFARFLSRVAAKAAA